MTIQANMNRLAIIALATLVAAGSATAQDEPKTRPTYQYQRFNEDWSFLRDIPPDLREESIDSIKYMEFDDDGHVWASFGGHARLRFENWNNFGSAPQNDDSFFLFRATTHGDFHFSKNMRAFAEVKHASSTDRDLPGGRRTLDADQLAIEQAFVDLTISGDSDAEDTSTWTLRPGRQTFMFGKQRLVSALPWSNTMRRWDSLTAIYEGHGWHATGFLSRFVPVRIYDRNKNDSGNLFYGAYATRGPGLDAYWLGIHNDNATFNGSSGNEDRQTLGGRWSNNNTDDTGMDIDTEGAIQIGSVGSQNIFAWMAAAEIGWKLDQSMSPRTFVGLDIASGDSSPGGSVQTFNQLYPLGHAYLGHIDIVGRQNVISINGGASIQPAERTTLRAALHYFWRYSNDDALYNAGGAVVRAGNTGSSHDIGAELDLTLKYRFDAHITTMLGYNHFFAGSFIRESGPSSGIDFIYAQAQYTF